MSAWFGIWASLIGCGGACEPAEEAFTVDRDLTTLEVEEAGWTLDDGSCEEVCEAVYQADTGWLATEVDACTLEPLDGSPDLAARLSCSGTGIEGLCL